MSDYNYGDKESLQQNTCKMRICYHCCVTFYETTGVNFTGFTHLNSHEVVV